MEETEIIKLSQQGDIHSFNILVERYQKEIFNFAVRILGNIHDAEDVCQISWISAWNSIGRFNGGSFRSWILHIVANDCRDEFRRRKRAATLSIDNCPISIMSNLVDNCAKDIEMREVIQEALLKLPHEQRTIITLREYNNLTYDEIAKVIGCSIGTVRSRLNRGRIKLRNILRCWGLFE